LTNRRLRKKVLTAGSSAQLRKGSHGRTASSIRLKGSSARWGKCASGWFPVVEPSVASGRMEGGDGGRSEQTVFWQLDGIVGGCKKGQSVAAAAIFDVRLTKQTLLHGRGRLLAC
jgi:hypothetical protein